LGKGEGKNITSVQSLSSFFSKNKKSEICQSSVQIFEIGKRQKWKKTGSKGQRIKKVVGSQNSVTDMRR